MTTLFAQPYDISATGFFFTSVGEYETAYAKNRNDHGQPVEEYEIQFIDGDDLDCALAKAWSVNQGNISQFLDATEDWTENQKLRFIIAVGECGYCFDPLNVDPDYNVDIHEKDTLRELAESFIDEGIYGPFPNSLANYIDYDAIAQDLSYEFTETTIAGRHLVYACS